MTKLRGRVFDSACREPREFCDPNHNLAKGPFDNTPVIAQFSVGEL